MKEIKFRAWDKEDKRMIVDKQKFMPLMITNKGVLKLNPETNYDSWILINENRLDLMQYTGLKDKEGKEIYEGDIVEGLVMFQDNLIKVKGVVKFVHGRFVIAEYNCSLYEFSNTQGKQSNEITIIGNKYENLKLLGGE